MASRIIRRFVASRDAEGEYNKEVLGIVKEGFISPLLL